MFEQLFAVARNTFTETLRQPVFVVLLFSGILMLALNPSISAFTLDMEGDNKLLIDLGLSTMLVAGLLLAAFSATGVFGREIENRTVLTVVSKPIGRPLFVLGKYLGVVAAVAVAYLAWTLVFLLSVRHGVRTTVSDPHDGPVLVFGTLAVVAAIGLALAGNYFYRWVFASTLPALLVPLLLAAYLLVLGIGKDWQVQRLDTDWNAQLWIGIALVFEALAILCAVALAASIRLGLVWTVVLSGAVFLLGLSNDYLFGRPAAEGSVAAALAAKLVPNLSILWMADPLGLGRAIDAGYVAAVSGYAALYVAALLGVAIALFQTREVG